MSCRIAHYLKVQVRDDKI
ncbi:hypothetical protein O9993_05860 [Vibrio lentus]|nr:hypothetical protein [Vibrio lentus]